MTSYFRPDFHASTNKRILILFAVILLALASSQKAGAAETARELANECHEIGKNPNLKRKRVYIPKTPGALLCFGYFQAIQNFLVLIDTDGNKIVRTCAPEETTLLQLIKSFLAYAEDHSTELHENAAVVALQAMQKAYPCPSQR